jgi:dihydroorotate dehydrogenase
VGDVVAMLRAGAACVDLFSSVVYEGWTVARDINRELAPMLGPVPAEAVSGADLGRVGA